jgi:DNA-binding LytR/AlgR family response regulator
MHRIKCLVTEDEPLARDVLCKYIAELDYLELTGVCADAMNTLHFLKTRPVDLLFLDIMMPRLNGIDMLRTLQHPPRVILTTAHPDYAIQAFELNAIDYLLKPIPFGRFVLAVNRFFNFRPAGDFPSFVAPVEGNTSGSGDGFIYLKADKKMVKLFLKDIIMIESLRDYVKVITTHQHIISYQKIGYLEERLPEKTFLRIHRSYIIAVDQILSFNTTSVDIASRNLPIGRSYKDMVMNVLKVEKYR